MSRFRRWLLRHPSLGRLLPSWFWPRPVDFDRMTLTEFEAYLDRTGFSARVAESLAEYRRIKESPSRPIETDPERLTWSVPPHGSAGTAPDVPEDILRETLRPSGETYWIIVDSERASATPDGVSS